MDTPLNVITIDQALAVVKAAMIRSKANHFAVITEPEGRVVLEPLDDDDKPYYELTAEGEASLRRAMKEESQGLGRPLSELQL